MIDVLRASAAHRDDLPAALARAFAVAPGGSNLVALGMAGDLATCARIDSFDVVPRLGHGEMEMVSATKSG